jgi:hypothetical protein
MRRAAIVLLLLAFAAGASAWRLADVKPNPNVQAVADGCQRDVTKIYTGFAPTWAYVNDRDFPATGPSPAPKWVTGTVKGSTGLLAARVSSSDDPITHHSYDVNVDVTVDAAGSFLTGVSRDGTRDQGTIQLDRESSAFPMWAWPRPGDSIRALGSWVWDCRNYGGSGEKTELHPLRAAWIVRAASPRVSRLSSEGDLFVSTDATPAGRQAECAHETKGSAQFKDCAHARADWLSVNGRYAFDLPAPTPTCSHPSIKAVDRGTVHGSRIGWKWTGKAWRVTFQVAAAHDVRVVTARQFFASCANAPKIDHLRLSFDRLLVRRAMDPSCAPDQPACPYANESTLLGQITVAPGEWQLTWSVDGIWGRWPGTLAANDGSTFTGSQSVDFYVQRGKPWTFVTLARECDFGALTNEIGNPAGDDYPGAIAVTYRDAAIGRHVSDSSLAGSTCPASNVHGCYQLTYTVSRIG